VEVGALGVGLGQRPVDSRCQVLDLGTPPGHAVLRDILQRPARR